VRNFLLIVPPAVAESVDSLQPAANRPTGRSA
jgi:hypothetical protein